MKVIKRCVIVSVLMISINTFAQQTLPKEKVPVNQKKEKPVNKKTVNKDDQTSKLSISAGIGVANYFGDLMEHNRFYSQSGFAFGAGASYAFANKFSARFDVGIQQVKAADSKNKGVQYKARNLSFKSNIVDIALGLDYYLLNIKKHGFTPYVSAGVGLMFFNPYANDISGKKQNLRELGTEGQGLAGFPGMYSKTAFTIPVGFGLKIAAGKNVSLHLELNYRFTGTDYLDDVSKNGYPDKALLDARNPTTAKFTWRGNEVGGEAYPKNLSLPRGNPKNKDGYYSTLFKVVYSFKKKSKKEIVAPIPVNEVPKDRDFDGITDAFDKCPDVMGSKENNGCPLPFVEDAILTNVTADSMTYAAYFDLDRSLLLPDAFKALKRIVEILKADNSLRINITGHSDNLGTNAVNMQLSADRAKVVRDYFISYNIAAERINSSYYGETKPLDNTQQWRNRRVEITISKK